MISFERNGRHCTRVDLAADTSADADELASASETWATGMPAGVASVTRSTGLTHVESCDPGAGKHPAGRSVQEALSAPLTRNPSLGSAPALRWPRIRDNRLIRDADGREETS